MSSPLSLMRVDLLMSSRAMKKKKAVTMPMFDPEIARIWEVPVLWNRVFVSSSIPVVSPIMRAFMMPGYLAPDASILFPRRLLHAWTGLSPRRADTVAPLSS